MDHILNCHITEMVAARCEFTALKILGTLTHLLSKVLTVDVATPA